MTTSKVISVAAHCNSDLKGLRQALQTMCTLRILPWQNSVHSLCQTLASEKVDLVVISDSVLPAGFISAMPLLSLCEGKPLLICGDFKQEQALLQLNSRLVLIRHGATSQHWQSALELLLQPLQQKQVQDTPQHYIPVRTSGRIHLVASDELILVKGCTNYVELQQQYKSYLHRTTITSLLETLDPTQFIRVHRSMVVNLRHLRGLRSEGGRLKVLEMAHGHEARIGKHYREQVMASLWMRQAI